MFIEERLLDKVSYGFTGGPTWATTAYSLTSGKIARNAERSRPLHVYSAAYTLINPADRSVVVDAFNACLGRVYGFRFKDWADYLLIQEPQGTAEAGSNVIQLQKAYTFGPTGQEITTIRPIIKPVDGEMIILLDNVAVSATIDSTTGEAEFTAVGGEIIKAVGQFDVPVMFDDDGLRFSMENWEANSAQIGLTEDFTA